MRFGSISNLVDIYDHHMYNVDMSVITITDPTQATMAGEWCRENLRPEDWNLYGHNLFTGSPTYDFEFADSKKAMLFALKWL